MARIVVNSGSPLAAAGGVENALGLVCMTAGEEIRFRTITRTRLRSLDEPAQRQTLRAIYEDNIRTLSRALDFCQQNGIRLFRLTSGLFPQSEDGIGQELVTELSPLLAKVGTRAVERGIRLVMHPDQFVVLSSDDDKVIANSTIILEQHARVLDLLQQPCSPWAAIQIHGGKGGRSDRLVATIASLDGPIRSRLALENDERAYGALEILAVCRRAGVPMVFDAHHHVIHAKLDSYDDPSIAEMTAEARATWPDPSWQLVHISNGREGIADARHADYIDVMPRAFRDVPWIEVEAKQKDLAVERLRRMWR